MSTVSRKIPGDFHPDVKGVESMKNLKLSVVIPARNEEKNVGQVLEDLTNVLVQSGIPYEIIVVDDNSEDSTAQVVQECMQKDPNARMLNRLPPPGFGRAVRDGLAAVTGEVVIICMADLSDDPHDVVAYYRKILEGYDCVFGSRFIKGGDARNYPTLKLILNRIANRLIQILFWTSYNDMTNAFKAYRTHVIHECGPFKSCHFNITIEIPLSAYIRKYSFAVVPIKWHGRTAGVSRFAIKSMGRRYLSTMLKCFFEYRLVQDDILADKLSRALKESRSATDLEERLADIERRIDNLAHRH